MRKVFVLILVLLGLVFISLQIVSNNILNTKYAVTLMDFKAPSDSNSQAEGERLVRVEHCQHYHGEHFTGGAFHHYDYEAEAVAPNITGILASYSDPELERLIRHGVKKNGTSVFYMPSAMYFSLNKEAVGKMISYLRTIKPLAATPGVPSATSFLPYGRMELISHHLKGAAEIIQGLKEKPAEQVSDEKEGKYIAMTTCTSCHGLDLKGGIGPNLIIAGAYSREQFIHLLQTGEGGLGRKNLTMMSDIAKNHLSYLHQSEMDSLFAFLKTSSPK